MYIDAAAYHVPPFFVYGTHRYIQACCQTLPLPAIASFAEPQAEERRGHPLMVRTAVCWNDSQVH